MGQDQKFGMSLHLVPTLCMRAEKLLASLSICAGWPEPLLPATVLSTKISCAANYGSFKHLSVRVLELSVVSVGSAVAQR